MTTGRPVEIPEARFERTGVPTVVAPQALGMHNWHPMAFSQDTGLVYLPVTVSAATYSPVKPEDFKVNMSGWNTGIGFSAGPGVTPVIAGGKPTVQDSYLLAWDPVTGTEKFRIKNEIYGASGVLATQGNLIFSGNHKGEFVAYDARDGKKLWTAPVQARVVAAAATYTVDGEQQVAILTGARGLPVGQVRTNPQSANNSRILVFKIGGKASLPSTMPTATASGAAVKVKIDPPLLTANNETVASGEGLFGANCAVCHGATAIPASGSIAPDLRYSALLNARGGWNGAVRDGDRAQRGMPGFKDSLTDEQTDAIMHYVIKRANDEKAAQEAASKQ
jgi:mono/diheme cytochrome c family protein